MIKTLFITLAMLFGFELKAQLFNLDSTIMEQFKRSKLPEQEKKNDNQSRFPVLVSNDVIQLFHLKDTILEGLQINYFTSRFEMAKKYNLKSNNKTLDCASIFIVSSEKSKVKIQMNYGYLKCNKWLFKVGSFMITNNGIFIIECSFKNLDRGLITVKEESY